MFRSLSAALVLCASPALANDPIGFVGVEFHMNGLACASAVDARKLATVVLGEHVVLDRQITNLIEAGKLSCSFSQQDVVYAGAVTGSTFTVNGLEYVIDQLAPVESVDPVFVWRSVPPAKPPTEA